MTILSKVQKGVFWGVFLPPSERGKKIENFFSPENERSHQYASNEVQTIDIGQFLVEQSSFLCFFLLDAFYRSPAETLRNN